MICGLCSYDFGWHTAEKSRAPPINEEDIDSSWPACLLAIGNVPNDDIDSVNQWGGELEPDPMEECEMDGIAARANYVVFRIELPYFGAVRDGGTGEWSTPTNAGRWDDGLELG